MTSRSTRSATARSASPTSRARPTRLERAVDQLFALPEGESHVLDAIIEAGRDISRREPAVAMIVVVSAGGQRPEQSHPARGLRAGAGQPVDRACRRDADDRRERPARECARTPELHQRPRRGSGAGPSGTAARPRRSNARRLRSHFCGERIFRVARAPAAPSRGRGRRRIRVVRREFDRRSCRSARAFPAARCGRSASIGRRASHDGSRPPRAGDASLSSRSSRSPPQGGSSGGSAPASVVRGSCGGCNVLLITIDTLRSDRVGAFGGTGHLTPTLDRLAGEALRFTRAYASAPLTLPSHASIMTAVSPPVHGVRNNSLFRLGEKLPTLATVLKSAGYRTGRVRRRLRPRRALRPRIAGSMSTTTATAKRQPATRRKGPNDAPKTSSGPRPTWIRRHRDRAQPISHPQSASQPWFAWVHLYDPHEPYRAPEPYASQHAPYDAEVAYTDAMVGRLLDELRAAGAARSHAHRRSPPITARASVSTAKRRTASSPMT